MKIKALLFSCLFFSLTTHAAVEGMKPGLWENTFSLKSKSGKVEKNFERMKREMQAMPADQRKMMEEMMAKQGLAMGGDATTMKVCVSKEQAENLEVPKIKNADCNQEIISRTKTSVKMKFNCKNNSSGTGEFNLNGPQAYTANSTINSVVNGEAEEMYIKQNGKWLSADCGNIKPLENAK